MSYVNSKYIKRKYSNREIAQVLWVSLDQVRRWALVVFPADAATEWGKGKKREYDIDETFKIYLISRLSSEYNMSLSEASTHLNNLWPHLMAFTLLPSQIPLERLDGELIDLREINIYIYIHKSYYEFRSLQDSKFISGDKSKSEFIETHRSIQFKVSETNRHPGNSFRTWIKYDEELIHFFDALRMAFEESLAKYKSLMKPFDLRKKKPSRSEGVG